MAIFYLYKLFFFPLFQLSDHLSLNSRPVGQHAPCENLINSVSKMFRHFPLGGKKERLQIRDDNLWLHTYKLKILSLSILVRNHKETLF